MEESPQDQTFLNYAAQMKRLRQCSDCSTMMSRRAWFCPACGGPNGAKHWRMLIYLALAMAVAAVFSGVPVLSHITQ